MTEAKVGEIVQVLLNVAIVIEHEINVIHKHENLIWCAPIPVVGLRLDIIRVHMCLFIETLGWYLVVIVSVESSGPALDKSTCLLYSFVHAPHRFSSFYWSGSHGFLVSPDPFGLFGGIVLWGVCFWYEFISIFIHLFHQWVDEAADIIESWWILVISGGDHREQQCRYHT